MHGFFQQMALDYMVTPLGIFFSLFFIAIGLAISLNPLIWIKIIQKVSATPEAVVGSGLTALPPSLLIVLFHNQWVLKRIFFVTAIGWLLLIVSLISLWVPAKVAAILKRIQIPTKHLRTFGICLVVLFLYVLNYYFGRTKN